MVMRLSLPSLALAAVLVANAATSLAQPAAAVVHVPPAEGIAGDEVELVAEAPATTPTLAVHYRRQGDATYRALELVRKDDARWVAVIPANAVVTPGLEYYVSAALVPVFASAEAPHRIGVTVNAATARRARDLSRAHGHRSRVHLGGEWVDYGTRTVGETRLIDRYYRVDADFAYRLLAYPLEEVRVGYTRLLGETQAATCPTAAPCTAEAGYKVGGWVELGLAPIEGLRFDVRLLVLATQSGFKVGGRSEARVGVSEGSHVALGVESMADVGTSGHFRLGWGTVPGVPMAATVEVTRLPDDARDTGVRLFYDIGRSISPNLYLGLRVGFASRNQRVAGYTAGANAILDF